MKTLSWMKTDIEVVSCRVKLLDDSCIKRLPNLYNWGAMLPTTSELRAKPYRVSLTFTLDRPEINMCEHMRDKPAGHTFTWTRYFANAKDARKELELAQGGYWDTSSEFVSTIDSARWSKRPRSNFECLLTFRKRVEGRQRQDRATW